MDFRSVFSDAIRFWERMRVFYNAGLLLIVVATFLYYSPQSSEYVDLALLKMMFILAVVANFFYSFAYIADVFFRASDFSVTWERAKWGVFVIGFTFASIITNNICQEIFQGH